MPTKGIVVRVLVAAAIALVAAVIAEIAVLRPDRALRVATGMTSWLICTETFIARLEPERVYREEIAPQGGMRRLLKRLRYEVDHEQRRVTTTWAGHFASTAVFVPERGCRVIASDESIDQAKDGDKNSLTSTTAATAEPALVTPTVPALQAALDRAFAEPAQPPYRQVRAIVVMRDGQIIAERYADGIGVDTPLLGYSVSKSVINAMLGVLVRAGKLVMDQPASVPAWADSTDPRHAITPNQLLRMSGGLDFAESGSGFDPVSRMLFLERDMAAFAEGAKPIAAPGTRWAYSSGSTLILSRIIRDAVGGHAEDVLRFARESLLDPLGIHTMTISFDGANTPVGSARMLASARDWAKFGQLYLDDGVVNGQRILPEGWVAYSSSQTLDSDYGAGFWINGGNNANARGRVRGGMPADTFFASGLYGQRVVVVPSQRLVIARFGVSIDGGDFDIEGLVHLVADVIADGSSNTASETPTP